MPVQGLILFGLTIFPTIYKSREWGGVRVCRNNHLKGFYYVLLFWPIEPRHFVSDSLMFVAGEQQFKGAGFFMRIHHIFANLAWEECLDYTLIDTRCLRATRTFDPPPLERLRESIALPSEYFPSDHIPVVVEVTYSDLDLGTWGPGRNQKQPAARPFDLLSLSALR